MATHELYNNIHHPQTIPYYSLCLIKHGLMELEYDPELHIITTTLSRDLKI